MSYLILIVEDDRAMRENIVDAILDEDGYEVHAAATVDEGLRLCNQHQFDLLVTDVRLPDDVDGVQGFHLMKRRLPDLRCIVITGYADPDPQLRAIKDEVDDWLYKPFDEDDLIAIIEKLLNPNKVLARYSKMLAKIPGMLVSAAAGIIGLDTESLLKKHHHKAFKALYTALKSNYIAPPTGNELFSELYDHEDRYISCLADPNEKIASQLIAKYKQISEKIIGLSQSKLEGLRGGSIPQPEFHTLVSAIQSNKITAQEFCLASTLRARRKSEFRNSPDLVKLRQLCWGNIE